MDALTRRNALSRFEALGRERGVPLTVQRRTVFEVLLDSTDHPPVEEVYRCARARAPGISQTTVYRVLDLLEHSGLATRIHHPDRVARYDADTSPHDHIRCTKCFRVVDCLERPAGIPPVPPETAGFEIRGYTVVYEGVCPECRSGANDRADEDAS